MLSNNVIKLRPITMNDLPLLNKWKNDHDVFKHLGGGYNPVSIDQQRNWMSNMMDLNGDTKRFIIENSNQDVMGLAGLYNISYTNRNCEFGIYIGEKEFHGYGYGKEATKLLLNFAYNNLNLKKVKLKVNVGNPAIHMYKQLGFECRGNLIEERFINGEYVDVLIMEKLKDENE